MTDDPGADVADGRVSDIRAEDAGASGARVSGAGVSNARPSRTSAPLAAALIAELASTGLTLAVAESLTGGLLAAELVAVPGASDVLLGGVVAYQSELKHSLLGVSAEVLAMHGAVHEDVAMQMAANVRGVLAVAGRPADVGVATTGVAGPGPSDGHPAGTVFVGVAIAADVRSVALHIDGDRDAIRRAVVYESLSAVTAQLESS